MSSALLLTKVDDLLREDHFYLDGDDHCYCLREYTARAGFGHSSTNDLIINLKKPMERRDRPAEWRWKSWAIEKCAEELVAGIRAIRWKLDGALLVPAPPSKTKAHPLHDDRILQITQRIGAALSLSVAELLENTRDREPQHARKTKRDIQAQIENLRFNGAALATAPAGIILVDDVLTTGATFVACKSVLQSNMDGIRVLGLFVARRVPQPEPPPVSDDFDDTELGDDD
jgi:hypothetical protein